MTGWTRVVSRRTFVRDLGHGAVALAVFGIAGCARQPSNGQPSPRVVSPTFDGLTYRGNLDEIQAVWCGAPTPETSPLRGSDPVVPDKWRWGQIGHSGSSAYVLVRGGEATLVDTGGWCTADVMEAGLRNVGLDWPAISSIVVTHKHPDHWIGLPWALERAPEAAVFAGAADIPFIASLRTIAAVGAGDRVMDLAIIPTPGHTPGHIAVHDEASGVLVGGDAVLYRKDRGFELLPTSEDLPQTKASLSILAGLSFDTLLLGHGDPIIGGAWEELTEYLAGT
jgi:glyoxylase-like metal-dependent hydrolase (beta-lactamase superfamily II)